MNTEHPAVHETLHSTEHSHHMRWWGDLKDKAEKCVRDVLEGGNHKVTLRDAIGKDTIELPEDWDDLMDYCKIHGGSCHDLNRLYRASAMWLQAYNELAYKRSYK